MVDATMRRAVASVLCALLGSWAMAADRPEMPQIRAVGFMAAFGWSILTVKAERCFNLQCVVAPSMGPMAGRRR